MLKFRVVRGIHNENGITYEKGTIVESSMDLCSLNSVGAIKFQRVESDVAEAARAGFNTINTENAKKPVPSGPDEFDSMSVPDLKKFAAQEGIEIGTASKKDELLVVIRKAVQELLEA